MKKYMILILIALLSLNCNGQKDKSQNPINSNSELNLEKQPNGAWKVDREYDENGNLIRYDSTYTWSSNTKLSNLLPSDRDSLMQSFKSKFYNNFSHFQDRGFEDVFSADSLFSKNFFNDDFFNTDFGKEYMDIDKIRQQMIDRQKEFLEKYQSEFQKSKDEN